MSVKDINETRKESGSKIRTFNSFMTMVTYITCIVFIISAIISSVRHESVVGSVISILILIAAVLLYTQLKGLYEEEIEEEPPVNENGHGWLGVSTYIRVALGKGLSHITIPIGILMFLVNVTILYLSFTQ